MIFNLRRREYEAKISKLEEENAQLRKRPAFVEVAKEVDLGRLMPEILDALERELVPILSQEAVRVLKTVLREMDRNEIRTLAAYDLTLAQYKFRFTVPQHNIEINVI